MNAHLHAGSPTQRPASHVLRFSALRPWGREIQVPCDAAGQVDLDSLPDRLLNAYLGARALVGREYDRPGVQAVRRRA